jgi:hypothetical protein
MLLKDIRLPKDPFIPAKLDRQLKDTQFNHSKIIRQIEVMLNELMIDYNQGLII